LFAVRNIGELLRNSRSQKGFSVRHNDEFVESIVRHPEHLTLSEGGEVVRYLLSALFCLWLTTSALSQIEPVDQAKVAKLVRQLDGGDGETRDRAEAELRKLGSQVLALLPDIDARTSGEKKVRLLRIRDHLEKLRVSDAAKGTRITLRGKMTLSDALSAIEEQTGRIGCWIVLDKVVLPKAQAAKRSVTGS
jgi:hypothetical protein